MKRIWAWISEPRAAQIALGLLLVIAIRSILEFFRIGGATGVELTGHQVFYIEGALAAVVFGLAVLVLHAIGRHRWATLATAGAIIVLLAWKIAVIGWR
ncbi:hypothetical protein RFN28_31600 [Mesorhizobium sp. VK24D]|uniref:Uncharacterized protein n=1 Tax=Mesorhizobium album TaxID=3072314 RepID=A0ABU4Y7Q4_9HYPH|nr:hypothetical protein [Mesorhizobium sp. VK24D]MDX8482970.1 hypothetical protein [Mesorhizobium sp. VK24D]